MICPQCKREVKTHLNRFGDELYNRHKLAKAWMPSGKLSDATSQDLQPGHNPFEPYTYELDCPMSNQPVE